MTLSILIVNWNSRELLRKCLLSIRSHCGGLNLQIVVVDSGSFDGCAEMLRTDFPEVEFVQSAGNIGFARANNLGFEHVRGEALFLLNPDTEILPNALQTMLEGLQRIPKAGIIGPRLLNSDGSLQTTSLHALPTPLNQAFGSEFLRRLLPKLRWWGPSAISDSTAPVAVEAISGAGMLMWSRTFRAVGGFNSQYFMYAEDMDLSLKVRRLGRNIYFLPAANVIHHGGGSSQKSFNKFSTVMMREALHRYMRLNHGLFSAFAYRVLMGTSSVVRLVLLGPGWLVANEKARFSHSVRKWSVIFNWSVGRETWVKKYQVAS